MFQVFEDLAFERDILSIQVKCSNHERECPWTGELQTLEVRWLYTVTVFSCLLQN